MNLNSIKYILFLILLYLFIYNPPFQAISTSAVELMIVPAILYIIVSWKWYNLIRVFKYEIFFFLLIIFFSFIRDYGRSESVFFKANVLLLLEAIILPFFLITLYMKGGISGNFIKDICLVGFIASLITFVAIVSPPFNDFIRNGLLKQDDFSDFLLFRSFGLSEGLTFGYGVVQGIIFALIFNYSRNSYKYLLALPFVLISILFNARTGMVPVVFVIFYFFIIKGNLKYLLYACLFIPFIYFLLNTDLFGEYTKTIEWAFDFFIQISDFMTGKAADSDENTFDTLFGRMAVFPETTFEWFFGTGKNIFVETLGFNSDVGYIIQLNYGGILYIFLFIVLIVYMIRRLSFIICKNEKWIVYLILFTIMIGNVKGLFISVNPNFRFIMLLYLFFVMKYKNSTIPIKNFL